jgi:hypothetical protein
MTDHAAPTDDGDVDAFIRCLTELAHRDDGPPQAKAEGAATAAGDPVNAEGSAAA